MLDAAADARHRFVDGHGDDHRPARRAHAHDVGRRHGSVARRLLAALPLGASDGKEQFVIDHVGLNVRDYARSKRSTSRR